MGNPRDQDPMMAATGSKKQGQNGDLEGVRTIDTAMGQIRAFFDQKRGTWRLQKSNHWTPSIETYYHPGTNAMMEFESEDEAWQWYEDWA